MSAPHSLSHDFPPNSTTYLQTLFSLSLYPAIFLHFPPGFRHSPSSFESLFAQPRSTTSRMPASSTWDSDTQVELLKVMNNVYRPNLDDCKKFADAMHAKGYTMSGGAILYATSSPSLSPSSRFFSSLPISLFTSHLFFPLSPPV